MKLRLFKTILGTSIMMTSGCLVVIPTLLTQLNSSNETNEIITTNNIKHSKNVQIVNSVDEIVIDNIMFSPDVSNSGAAIVNNNGKQEIYVWGANSYGQLGLGHKNSQRIPTLLSSDLLGNYTSITEFTLQAFSSFAKVQTNDGEKIYAWGRNELGQLGLGNNTDVVTPTIFETTYFTNLVSIKKISFFQNNRTTCLTQYAIIETTDGTEKLYVWGDNSYGQLGNNSTTSLNVPTLFDTTRFGDYLSIKELNLDYSAYAILTTNTNEEKIFVWGYNTYGQLGINNTQNQLVPVAFTSFISGATIRKFSINVNGRAHMILNRNNIDELYTWGNNGNGSLGVGDGNPRQAPQRIPNSSFGGANEIISFESPSSIALLRVKINTEEKLYVCGYNTNGQLGLGNTSSYFSFTLLPNSALGNYTEIYAINDFHNPYLDFYNRAYVKTPNGDALYVWGANSDGQLGLGNKVSQYSPVKNDAFNLNDANTKIVNMYNAGPYFNPVTIEENGKLSLYSTGSNNSWQNATGSSTDDITTFTSALPARRTMPYPKGIMTTNLTPAEALQMINPNGIIDLNELNNYVDTSSFPSGSALTINIASTTVNNETGELNLAIDTNQYYDILVKDAIVGNQTYKVNISGFRKSTNINTSPVKVLAESFNVPSDFTIDKLYSEIVDSNFKVINRVLLEQYLDLQSIPPSAELFFYLDTNNGNMQATFTFNSNQVYLNGITTNQSYTKQDLLIVILPAQIPTNQLNLTLIIALSFVGGTLLIVAIITISHVIRMRKRRSYGIII